MRKKYIIWSFLSLFLFILILFTIFSCSFFENESNFKSETNPFLKLINNIFNGIKNIVIKIFEFLKNIVIKIINFFGDILKSEKNKEKKYEINKNSVNTDNSKTKYIELSKKEKGKKLNKDFIVGFKYFSYILKFSYYEALYNFINNKEVKEFVEITEEYNEEPLKLYQDESKKIYYSFLFINGKIYLFIKNSESYKFYKIKEEFINEIESYGFEICNNNKNIKNSIFYYYIYSFVNNFNKEIYFAKRYKRFSSFEIVLLTALFVIVIAILVFFDRYYSYFLEYKALMKMDKKLEKSLKISDNNSNKSSGKEIMKKDKSEKNKILRENEEKIFEDEKDNMINDKEDIDNMEDEILDL